MARASKSRDGNEKRRTHRVAALFAGIGGIELGLEKAGHETLLFCENDPAACAVLESHFKRERRKYPIFSRDVRELRDLPKRVNMVTAGFPCQDLSQAGRTNGINGSQSGLVGHVFRLLRDHDIPWLLLENVPFMLQLDRGGAMAYLVGQLENLGYSWAYRVIDTRAFGIPQRRLRVYLVASKVEHPATLLFRTSEAPEIEDDHRGRPCGFYWTEGTRGLGWAVDAVPTLKKGSTLGIPSPPAIWMPTGRIRIGTPEIRDAERLQGFPEDWTKPAEDVLGRRGKRYRWALVGNAVTTRVSEWLGDILAKPGGLMPDLPVPLRRGSSWPSSAFGGPGERPHEVPRCTTWPVKLPAVPLIDYLKHGLDPLSAKATEGFLKRLEAGRLRRPVSFDESLHVHLAEMRRVDRFRTRARSKKVAHPAKSIPVIG